MTQIQKAIIALHCRFAALHGQSAEDVRISSVKFFESHTSEELSDYRDFVRDVIRQQKQSRIGTNC